MPFNFPKTQFVVMLSQLAINSGNITDRFGTKFDQRYRVQRDHKVEPVEMVQEEPLVLLDQLKNSLRLSTDSPEISSLRE